jgi:RES domain-containing protein
LPPQAAAISGTWWRHVPAGYGPWQRPPVARQARWQRGSTVDALYFADQPETAWAEWYRALAERALPPLRGMPRDLWGWSIDLPRVADLRGEAGLAAHGLALPRPTRAEWPAFQAAGEALHAAGWPALVAPSAARPGSVVLCVFRATERPSGVAPLPPPERIDDPPPPPRGMTT